MIEDKKLGLKIAENPKEKLWFSVTKKIKEEIEMLRNSLIVQEQFLKTAQDQLQKSTTKEAK